MESITKEYLVEVYEKYTDAKGEWDSVSYDLEGMIEKYLHKKEGIAFMDVHLIENATTQHWGRDEKYYIDEIYLTTKNEVMVYIEGCDSGEKTNFIIKCPEVFDQDWVKSAGKEKNPDEKELTISPMTQKINKRYDQITKLCDKFGR